jgi:hypothetical protein
MAVQTDDGHQKTTKLERISKRASFKKETVFNNIGHAVDLDLLRECYRELEGKKAIGIDGVSKASYGERLAHEYVFRGYFPFTLCDLGFGSPVSLSTLRHFRYLRRRKTRYVVESVLLLRQDLHLQDKLDLSWRTGSYKFRCYSYNLIYTNVNELINQRGSDSIDL